MNAIQRLRNTMQSFLDTAVDPQARFIYRNVLRHIDYEVAGGLAYGESWEDPCHGRDQKWRCDYCHNEAFKEDTKTLTYWGWSKGDGWYSKIWCGGCDR